MKTLQIVGPTGFWSSWINTRTASLASASMRERLMVSPSVGCSTAPFEGIALPKYLSSDNDPLYRFHQWQANLRILEVTEIKSIPYVPLSHPFVERLIGTLRREYLEHLLFWTTADLENKLLDFRTYFNNQRTHSSREGRTPVTPVSRPIANLRSFRWQPHCRSLYHTPMAA